MCLPATQKTGKPEPVSRSVSSRPRTLGWTAQLNPSLVRTKKDDDNGPEFSGVADEMDPMKVSEMAVGVRTVVFCHDIRLMVAAHALISSEMLTILM